MKRLFLLLSLVFPMMLGAQQWEIGLDNNSVINGGVMDESETAILVGFEYDDDMYHAAAFKIYEDGEYEVFSFNKEYKNISLHNIVRLPDGNYFVSGSEDIGSSGNNNICDIHVMILDDNLNVIKHEKHSADENFIFGDQHDIIVDDDKVIMVCETFGDNIWGRKPTFLKFDIDGELQDCMYPTYVEEDDLYGYNHIDFSFNQLKKRPDGSGYVVIAKYTGTGMHLLMYDNDLKFQDNIRIEHPDNEPYYSSPLYNNYAVCSDLWLSDDDLMLFGSFNDHHTDDDKTDFEVIISSVNLDGSINKYEVISSDSCHSAFQGNGGMRYVNDSTIYGGYYSSAHHVIEPFYPQICMFTKDLEILGIVTITDDKSVGHKYMLTYNNGGILYISSHLNPTETERTIIKKYSREDFLKFPLSVKDIPAKEIEGLVYPNPTVGELNIDIRGIGSDKENRIRIIDINGRTMMSRIIRGDGNVLSIDVSILGAGTYIYEIFNTEATLSRGRFVKK